MIKRNFKGLIIILFIGFGTARGQDNASASKLIQKIDSVAKVKEINEATVKILYVTSSFDKTSTDDNHILAKKGRFSFDGQFLVIAETYFNINKLLYFRIKEKSFEFYFQGY